MRATLEGRVIDGRFQLGRRVGRGGMGEVYRARDLCTDRVVALKILTGDSDRLLERFARETHLLARLRHPAIVAYLGDGLAAPRRPYLTMEWLDGEELACLLKRGPIAPAGAVAILRRVAEALAFVHARGVVHRDIKPSNLFVVAGQPASLKLIDLGIALEGSCDDASLTATGAAPGTPGYMAPEQVRCEPAIGPPADVFALGCVVYECLAGRRAFTGEHAAAVHARTLLDDLPPVGELCPQVPRGLEWLLERMLCKEPGDRPADGAELLADLDALVGEAAAADGVTSRDARTAWDDSQAITLPDARDTEEITQAA